MFVCFFWELQAAKCYYEVLKLIRGYYGFPQTGATTLISDRNPTYTTAGGEWWHRWTISPGLIPFTTARSKGNKGLEIPSNEMTFIYTELKLATEAESAVGEHLGDAHLPEPGVPDEGAVAPGADGEQRADVPLREARAHQLQHPRHSLPAPRLVRRRRRHLGGEPRREEAVWSFVLLLGMSVATDTADPR